MNGMKILKKIFSVTKMAHDVYDDMFAIIVRPNKNMKHLNEEFVVKDLCKGKSQKFLVRL